MKSAQRPARINIKAVVILTSVVGLLGVGAVVGHYVRKRITADRALAAGIAALEGQQWAEACEHLKIYLNKYPDDQAILEDYAEANMLVRPQRTQNIGRAIGAYRRLLRFKPGDKEYSTQLTEIYFQARRYDDAVYICNERLKVAPDDVDALLALGTALADQRKNEQSIEVLERLIEKHPDSVRAYVLRSILAVADDSMFAREQACQWIDLGVEKNPDSAEARIHRARFYSLTMDDQETARDELHHAEQLNPADPNILLALAEAWILLGDFERGNAALALTDPVDSDALKRFELDADTYRLAKFNIAARAVMLQQDASVASELAERSLQEAPEYERVKFLPVAVDLYLLGQGVPEARQALDEYTAAIAREGKDLGPAITKKLALMEAGVALAEGKPYVALDRLEDIAAASPESEPLWWILWQAYEQTYQHQRATEALEHYVTLRPRNPRALLALSQAYLPRDIDKSIQLARAAERVLPNDLAPMLQRIKTEIISADLDGDPARLQRSDTELALLRSAHAESGQIRLLQASIALQQERPEDAIAGLRSAVQECSPDFMLNLQLARILSAQGKLDQARRVCKEAVQRFPDLGAPRITLARILGALGRPDDSRAILQRAVDELRGDAKLNAGLQLARHYVVRGLRDEAITVLDLIHRERPEDVRPAWLLLQYGEVQDDQQRAQDLVDEIKRIEGDKGLLWRVAQARLLQRSSDRMSHRTKIHELLTHAFEVAPGWPVGPVALGRMYEDLGNEVAAERTYRRSLLANPTNLAVIGRLLMLFERQRRYTDAEQLIEQLPRHLSASNQLRANLAIGLGEYSTAAEDLEAQVAADPRDAPSRVMLARLLYGISRDADKAMKLLDEARLQDPDLITVAATEATILSAEGDQDKALATIQAEIDRRGDFDAYLLRAEFYSQTGRPELAEKDFVHLMTMEGSTAAACKALGAFYHRHGRTDEAIAAWQKGIDVDPDGIDMKRMLVRASLGRGDSESRARAISMLTELLALRPEDTELLTMQAAVLLDRGNEEAAQQAESILRRVVGDDSRNVKAYQLLIRMAYDRGDMAAAGGLSTEAYGANPRNVEILLLKAVLETKLNNVRLARDLCDSVLQLDPGNIAARNQLTQLALRDDRLDEAERYNEEALALGPSDERVQLLRARILDQRQLPADAIARLEAFRTEGGTRAGLSTLLALARLYAEQGDFSAAEARLKTAAEGFPQSPAVLFAGIKHLGMQGRFDEALSRIARHDGSSILTPELLTNAASVLSSSREKRFIREAKSLLERAITADPNYVQGHLGLGKVTYQLGEYDQSAESYRRILEIEPYHVEALNDLAWIMGEALGRLDEGLQLANRGLARYPDDPHLLDTRGVLLAGLGRSDEARQDFERCLELAGDIPDTRARAQLHLGRVCVDLGKAADATRWLEAALELDKKHDIFSPSERAEVAELMKSASSRH